MTQDFEDNLKIDTMHNFFACQITKIFMTFYIPGIRFWCFMHQDVSFKKVWLNLFFDLLGSITAKL